MRAIFLLGFFVSCFSLSYAQRQLSFGVQTQIGFTDGVEVLVDRDPFGSINFLDEHSTLAVPLAGGGAWLAYCFSEHVSLRLGLQYVNSGNLYQIKGSIEDQATGEKSFVFEQRNSFRAHQVQAPLELQISIGQRAIRPIISVGVQATHDWITETWGSRTFMDGGRLNNILRQYPEGRDAIGELTSFAIQPIASIGVRLNTHLAVQFRRTWMGAVTNLNRYPDGYEFIVDTNSTFWNNYLSGDFNKMQSSHRGQTSIVFSYEFF